MKNVWIKISFAAVSTIGATSLALASQPIQVPEPGIFGIFAGAVAIAIIVARIFKNK